jgi:hypothetical protein
VTVKGKGINVNCPGTHNLLRDMAMMIHIYNPLRIKSGLSRLVMTFANYPAEHYQVTQKPVLHSISVTLNCFEG